MRFGLGRIGVLFVVTVIALSGIGGAFAAWTDQVTVSGTTETGKLEWQWRSPTPVIADEIPPPPYYPVPDYLADWNCSDGFGEVWRSDKNVAWASGEVLPDGKTVQLEFKNVYPCHWNSVSLYATNTGTIPLKFERVIINGQSFESAPLPIVELDLDGDGKADIEIWWKEGLGEQIHPGEDGYEWSFWFHVFQDAPQNATLSFTITLEAVQWSKSIH